MTQDFNTQQEIWEWLLAGNKVVESLSNLPNDNIIVSFIDGIIVDQNGRERDFSFNYPKNWNKYIKPQWYENIPDQGVLCWVDEGKKSVELITSFTTSPFMFYNFYNHKYSYICVKPLTEEEIKQFLPSSK